MKINYVPGLALRFFPGLSRELYDAVDTYLATNAKIAVFTGTAPTEQALWNLTNFNDYVTAHASTLVYQETTTLQFSYDGFKHKRVIQRYPVDSTAISPLIAPIAQDHTNTPAGEDAIHTPNDLYALVYCPDKDVTLNTTGNDLVFLLPGVGSGSTDFFSLSNTTFQAGDPIYLRNMTVALFQGYQITDTLITEQQEDPNNPGQMIDVPVDTKKSIYINKVWGNRLSEAYRDCFISKEIKMMKNKIQQGDNQIYISMLKYESMPNSLSDFMVTSDIEPPTSRLFLALRRYNKITGVWETSATPTHAAEINQKVYFGFLGNQSLINLIDEINNKSLLGQLGNPTALITQGPIANMNNLATSRFHIYDMTFAVSGIQGDFPGSYSTDTLLKEMNGVAWSWPRVDVLPGLLIKYILHQSHQSQAIKDSVTQLLIELGFDEGMVNSALKSIVPIDFDNTKYNSTFTKDTGILTIQNSTPAKLKTRFKKAINNPTNEAMYIISLRYLNRWAIENPYASMSWSSNPNANVQGSTSSVSYPATTKIIEGESVTNSTQRIRQQDYTALSIGQTGNGNTDLEFDLIDTIDYIDSFTAMVKIPNKF